MSPEYEAAGQEIKRRILALIPSHPELLDLKSARDLGNIPDLKLDDIKPSYAMLQAALELAWG